MYKYIKGITVLSESKMPNSLEIAEEYNLWMPFTDSLSPNGELIDFVIKSFLDQNNHKVSNYYYLKDYNVSFRVYPMEMVIPIMKNFIQYLEQNNIKSDRNKIYTFGNTNFIYYEIPEESNKIISLEEYKKRKEAQND